jgi:putative membrane protein
MPWQSASSAVEQEGEPKMMYYGGGHMSGWGWFGLTIGLIVFWGLLIALAVIAYRALTGGSAASGQNAGTATTDPRQILAQRYARSEIDEDEYSRRLATLSGTPHQPVA